MASKYTFEPDPPVPQRKEAAASPEPIHVVCAALVRDGRLFAALRGHGAIGWELPGGKVEPGETAEQALRREIREELGLSLSTCWYLDTVDHEAGNFRMRLDCFVCPLDEGQEPVLTEHTQARWLTQDELDQVAWLPADRRLADTIGLFWDQLFSPTHL